MKISRLFNTLPKKLAASGLIALAFLLPAATMAASTVKIEADTTVANASTGSSWSSSTSASYDQVVDIQVVYDNDEAAGSGKTASNLSVKINIPTTAGTNQVVTTKTSADNSNAVNGSAKVTLNRADAYLQYIPGTAVWKHASTANGPQTTTQKISDAVVTNANGLRLENETPCQAGSVQVQARVMVPGLTVDKYVRLNGTTTWATSINAKAGDTVQYEIAYHNTGNTTQQSVEFRDQLPKGITYVPGTTMLKDGVYPNGTTVNSDALTANGFIANSYAPGAAAYVMFNAKVADESQLSCGNNLLRNTAFVQPKGMNYYYNTADVNVNKTCQTQPPTPEYSCNLLTLSKDDNRTVEASVTHSEMNATYKSTSFAWGDGKSDSGTATSASHSYAADGTYNVVATVSFTVDGKTVTATNDCKGSVTFKTTPPPTTPVYSCDLLSLSQGDNRTVTASVAYTAQDGATFKTATLDWGDQTTPLVTSNTTATHTYAADGTYNVTAKVLFSVNGTDTFATSENCAKQVTITTTPPSCQPGQNAECTPCQYNNQVMENSAECVPPTLPNTGAGDVIGIFAGVVAASTIGYRVFLGRKLARR